MEKTVTIEKEKLQKLLKKFNEICSICDELDIYEHKGLDKSMQKKQEWVEKHFGEYL